jgi:hypothetical protein
VRRCLAILTLVAGLAVLAVGGVTAADNGAMIIRSTTGCELPGPDPEGNYPGKAQNIIPTSDCSYQVVSRPDGTYHLQGHGQLPAGTTLPGRAVHTTTQEYGRDTCWTKGDKSRYVVTPSGRVNFTCTNR